MSNRVKNGRRPLVLVTAAATALAGLPGVQPVIVHHEQPDAGWHFPYVQALSATAHEAVASGGSVSGRVIA